MKCLVVFAHLTDCVEQIHIIVRRKIGSDKCRSDLVAVGLAFFVGQIVDDDAKILDLLQRVSVGLCRKLIDVESRFFRTGGDEF